MPDVDPRRPRPVADAPIAAVADGTAVAKAWMLHLLAAAPLDQAGAVDVRALAEHGPSLCAAVLRAIGSDHELARLQPGGDLGGLAARTARLAGAEAPGPAVAAVEALRAATWQELWFSLRRPSADLVRDLAERLAHVCAVLAQSAVAGASVPPATSPPDPGAADDDGGPVRAWRAAPAGEARWAAMVARAVELHGAPVGVLAIDVDDADRLLRADEEAFALVLDRVERVLAAALEPGSELGVVAAGRYGVTVPGADAPGARALGERLAAAVAATAAPRGVPLRASVGVATFPQDGEDAATLAGRAEERAFAARATGAPAG